MMREMKTTKLMKGLGRYILVNTPATVRDKVRVSTELCDGVPGQDLKSYLLPSTRYNEYLVLRFSHAASFSENLRNTPHGPLGRICFLYFNFSFTNHGLDS